MRNLAVLALACTSLAGPLLAQQPGPKRRVAVMNFDFSAVQNSVNAIFQTNQDVGKGVADLIVDRLVQNGRYSVIERKALDKVLAEQNFSNSDRADPNSAAKIGRLLGVDAIVVGSITNFGRDDKTTKVGGEAMGGLAGRFGIGGVGRRTSKAVVELSARLVNVETGEIMATAHGRGESERQGTSLLGSGGSAVNAGGGGYDMSSSNFANTILGEAVRTAVNQLTGELNQEAAMLPAKAVHIEGLVAYAGNGVVVLNIGSRQGIRVGDQLKIARPTMEIKDPATGRVIKRMENAVGTVIITEVDEKSATGNFSGSGTPKVGDTAKN